MWNQISDRYAFTDDVIHYRTHYKRATEVNALNHWPHPWEFGIHFENSPPMSATDWPWQDST